MAKGDFFAAFNAGLPAMQATFEEDWLLDRTQIAYAAIGIDQSESKSQIASGGKFLDTRVLIFVTLQQFTSSGVRKGDIVVARGTRFSVEKIDDDGDDARILVCGPAGVFIK